MSEKSYPPHSQMMYDALAKKRVDCDLVQSDVAMILGIDRGALNRIFTGRTELTARMARDIAFVLDIDALELLQKQSEWKLSNMPRNEFLIKRIRERVQTLEARKAAQREVEIQNLEKERESIDARIGELKQNDK